MLIFTHIPKSGGTSLDKILEDQYGGKWLRVNSPDHWLSMSAAEKEGIKVVSGHFRYGIHEVIPGEHQYISLMREPVHRLVSHYVFAISRPDHYIHKKLIDRDPELKRANLEYEMERIDQIELAERIHERCGVEDYVLSGVTTETDNSQTRIISGMSPPFGECNDEMVEVAIRNIRDSYAYVGIMERFVESMERFEKILDWPMQSPTVFVNKGVELPISKEISNEVKAKIRAFNRYDSKLYNHVKKEFSEWS